MSKTIHVNGFSMAYTDEGAGQPLLFVHGYPLNRRLWAPQALALSGQYRVLAVDLRGHGESDPVPGPYNMDLLADDLNAFLDALHIDQPVVLCGLSMGGYVAFAFWRRYAARLCGLILTATRAAADSDEARRARDAAIETARTRGVSAIVEGMLPKMLAPLSYEQRPELVQQVRQILLATSLEGVLGDLAALRDRVDSTATLSQINVPVMIVHGREDQIIPLKEAEGMAAQLRRAELQVLSNAGHLPNLENTPVFNQAVRQFVTDLNSDPETME
ncbi:MAG: alpha/beta fold hydrolase [Chloroflexota bacterium]